MTSADDDFEALFDEVSAKRDEPETLAATPPVAEKTNTDSAQALPNSEDAGQTSGEEEPMFNRLGGIVRLLHDSLRELGYDRSLSDVASQINDAQDRLEYVATLTEQAANKVLNAIDAGIPEQDMLVKTAKNMETRWTSLFDGKMSIEEFKTLAGDSREFAKDVAESIEKEKSRMLEIMMAQDFQDITGQLIKKIVGITNTVEHELAQLLLDSAPQVVKAAIAENKPLELMQGPSTPAAALVQDDVDSLLADLGF